MFLFFTFLVALVLFFVAGIYFMVSKYNDGGENRPVGSLCFVIAYLCGFIVYSDASSAIHTPVGVGVCKQSRTTSDSCRVRCGDENLSCLIMGFCPSIGSVVSVSKVVFPISGWTGYRCYDDSETANQSLGRP